MKLGISEKSQTLTRKAKTHKGRKIRENKESKVVENDKKSIILKGNKSSEIINSLLRELHSCRGNDLSRLFLKKAHDMHPFDSQAHLESMGVKADSSLFVVGNH